MQRNSINDMIAENDQDVKFFGLLYEENINIIHVAQRMYSSINYQNITLLSSNVTSTKKLQDRLYAYRFAGSM